MIKGVTSLLYTGIYELIMNEYDLAKFYETKENPVELLQNQYLIIKNKNGDYIDNFRWNGKRLVKLNYETISNSYTTKIKPRNKKQECLFDLLQNKKITTILITGGMGSGKTFCATLHAFDLLEKEKVKKIIYIRNNTVVPNTENIGALPGTLTEKLTPFIMPLVDIVGSRIVLESLERKEQIEYCHLGFIRGRSFEKSVILVSEAENLTKEHIKLLLGRVGEGSYIIFEGDTSQTDKKVFDSNSGICALREILKGNPLFGAVELDKTERSETAELSDLF